MSADVRLGKIESARFGFGGYQDAELGFWLVLSGPAWGVGTGMGCWSCDRSDSAEWTEADRDAQFAAVARLVLSTLRDAGAPDVEHLEGVPVEVTFEDRVIAGWRVLKEVL